MRTIGFESSGDLAAVAVAASVRILAVESLESPRGHARWLVPLAARALESVSWTPRELELVAVNRGPGSYAGVRVGIAVAKSLCLALDLPIVGLDALDLAALEATSLIGRFAPVLDARRGHIVTALFERDVAGARPRRLSGDTSARPEEILDRLESPTTFFGPGVETYRDRFEAARLAGVSREVRWVIRAETVALEAERVFDNPRSIEAASGHVVLTGRETDDMVGLYLRATAAEENRR